MTARKRRLPAVGGKTPIKSFQLDEFARRLYARRTELGLSQSDLARTVWGETMDKRGYMVAKNRARISAYESGEHYPDQENLVALADALDMPVEQLAPDLYAASVDHEKPEISLTAVAGHPDKVHYQLNTLIPLEVAAEITMIVSRAKGALGSAG